MEENTAGVPAKQLSRFLNKKFRPTQVSVASSIPYDTVLSRRRLRNVGMFSTCTFDLEGDGIDRASVTLRLDYDRNKRWFWCNKERGASIRVNVEGEDSTKSESLAEFLNQKQDVILIGLGGGNMVYQERNFYSIDYSYAEEVLLDLITRPVTAPPCRTEKGSREEIEAVKTAKATAFPVGSLFRAIADRRIDLPFEDALLICDDLGTECADFLAAN